MDEASLKVIQEALDKYWEKYSDRFAGDEYEDMQAIRQLVDQGRQHVFEPYHKDWHKPRCKVCREFEDHPIHIQEEQSG